MLAAGLASVASCNMKVQTSSATIPMVEEILSQPGSRLYKVIEATAEADSEGAIAIIGSTERGSRLSRRFLICDDHDNVDGRCVRDRLPDFAGETIMYINDPAGQPLECNLDSAARAQLREIAVRNIVAALDTTCCVGAFDTERLGIKPRAKIAVVASPMLAEYGAFDVDTLLRSIGSSVKVIYPSRVAMKDALEHDCKRIGVLTDSCCAGSGIYRELFQSIAKSLGKGTVSCHSVNCPDDSTSFALEYMLNDIARQPGSGAIDAIIVDDSRIDVKQLYEQLEQVMTHLDERTLMLRRSIHTSAKVYDMARIATDECYHSLRESNIFTHDIAYPKSAGYKMTRLNGSEGEYALVPMTGVNEE